MKWMSRPLALLSFLACVWIAVVNPGPFVRGTLGDVLVVFFLYFLCQSVRSFSRLKLAFVIFAFACLVETAQGMGVFSRLASRGSVVLTITGSTFDWADCAAYAAGLAGAWLVDLALSGIVSSTNEK